MRDRFVAKVDSMLARERMLARDDSVLVAVSGGPDSVALAAAMVAIAGKERRIGLGHVNHGLRGRASDSDQRFVERLGAALGVAVHVRQGRVAPGGNLEERARVRRYRVLADIARRNGFSRIAVAHTRDDQAETVLLRLLRGAGGGGLGAMAPVREDGIIRPLLECTRAEITAFLARRGLVARSDRSNRNRRFTRNRLRLDLLPRIERDFNPAIREALVRTARLLRDDEAYLTGQAAAALRRHGRAASLDGAAVARLAPALQRRVIRLWLSQCRGDLRRLGASHVESVRRLALGEGQQISLPGGKVARAGGRLRWGGEEEPPRPTFPVPISGRWQAAGDFELRARRLRRGWGNIAPGRWRAVFDLGAIASARVIARSFQPGDRLRPLGLGGTKKLQDVFVDAKVPRAQRSRWPVVATAEGGILWVPGLVRSDRARVGSGTTEVLVIEARRGRTLVAAK